MRLIDADALPKYTGYALSANEVAKAVETAPTVDAEPKWIPCSERLPESNGEYLTTSESWDKQRQFMSILNYGEADFAKTNPCWYYYDSEWGDVTVNNVIAWMPLPEPYKMDGKEQNDGKTVD